MKEIKVIDTIEEKVWDSFVDNPMQSFAWGESRKALGTELVRFGVYHENVLVNVFHMTLHGTSRISYKVGYIARSFLPDNFVCQCIKNYAKDNKIIFVKWEPNVFKLELKENISNLLKRTSKENFARWTQILDLSQNTEAIFGNFSKTVRRDIRFGEKNGLSVVSGITTELYKDFEELFFKTTTRQKFSGHSEKYHKEVFTHMSQSEHSKIFVVYDQDRKAIAASEVFFFNKKAYYVYAGSLGKSTPVGAMYILVWAIIQYAKTNNYSHLDFWGSLPPVHSPQNPWAGFTKFKKAFSGEFREYVGSYDLVVYPFLYKGFNFLFTMRKTLTFLRKKIS